MMFKDPNRRYVMQITRIVSLLPSATELLYELGAQSFLYGVTHECKYPEDAKTKPQIISSIINTDELSSKEIDAKIRQMLNEEKDIFVINKENLLQANPDLIISQKTCEVCTTHLNQVDKAIQMLEKKPLVHSMDPHNLQEILDSVNEVGKIIKKDNEAKKIVRALEKKIEDVKKYKITIKPKVLAIEWISPLFTAGHWIPELIEIAGGENLISKKGESSRPLNMDEIVKLDPDIVILMPCGFNISRTLLEYNVALKNNSTWNQLTAVKNKNIFAVDADAYFSKASIRTVTGLEILAKIIHPKIFTLIDIPENSIFQLN